ncbi:hypothetical protein FQA39_LY09731 [Lamprigera yunnana]|nr:hypothetical protein FQA39_LY09731 [Lamprigera yunnana]
MDEGDEEQRTVWCGNLSERMSEEVLYELFLQAAPLERVYIPKDKSGKCLNYGFVTFKHLCSVQYSVDALNGISLYGKKIIIKPRNGSVQRRKFNSFTPTVANIPLSALTDLHSPPENSLGSVDLLMQLGSQLLLNNNRNYFNQDYREERFVPSNRGESSNHHNENRDKQRSYRRYNNYRHNDRYLKTLRIARDLPICAKVGITAAYKVESEF